MLTKDKGKMFFVGGNYQERVNMLNFHKEKFMVSKTNRTTMIHVIDKDTNTKTESYLYASERIPAKYLHLIKQTRDEVMKHSQNIKGVKMARSPFDIKYFSFKKSLKNLVPDSGSIYQFPEVYQLDLTKAYYRAFLNLGFISKKFFEKCVALPKSQRLRLLGSIATVKHVTYYDKGKQAPVNWNTHKDARIESAIVENPLLREAWFKGCSYVANAMQTLVNILDKNFLFYWVDGIYFTGMEQTNHNGTISMQIVFDELMEKLNFDYTLERVSEFELVNKNGDIQVTFKNAKGTKKLFHYPKEKIVSYNMVTEDFFS